MSQQLLLAVFVLFSSSVKQSFRSLTFDVFTWPIFSNDLDRDTISPQIVRGIRLFKKIAIVFGSSFCPIFFSLRNANDDDDDDDDDVSPRLLLASSFSYFFSSSSFPMVRSNTSSSIGFVTNMLWWRWVCAIITITTTTTTTTTTTGVDCRCCWWCWWCFYCSDKERERERERERVVFFLVESSAFLFTF